MCGRACVCACLGRGSEVGVHQQKSWLFAFLLVSPKPKKDAWGNYLGKESTQERKRNVGI